MAAPGRILEIRHYCPQTTQADQLATDGALFPDNFSESAAQKQVECAQWNFKDAAVLETVLLLA